MNYREYLLSKLAEEASEIAQIAIKSQVFGFDSVDPRENGENNLEKLEKELLDLLAVVQLLFPDYNRKGCGTIPGWKASEYLSDKQEKLIKYYNVHKELSNDQ